MASLFELNKYKDERGCLSVLEKELPFPVKRVFFIYDVPSKEVRGKHGHLLNRMVLTCVTGSCDVNINNGKEKTTISLDSLTKCLLLEPDDWHQISNFSDHAVLSVFCSEEYSKDDYFFEEPK